MSSINPVLGVQLRMVGRIHGQTTNNVLHFATEQQIQDAPSQDALILALLTAFLACVSQQLVGAVTSDWTLDFVDARAIFPAPGNPIQLVPQQAVVGTLGPASHSFAASLVNIRGEVGGRQNQGKIFLPPPGEANTTSSLADQTVVDQLVQFINCVAGKFIGANATEAWRLGVLSSKRLGLNIQNFNIAFTPAVGLTPKREAAICGRRRIGRGI